MRNNAIFFGKKLQKETVLVGTRSWGPSTYFSHLDYIITCLCRNLDQNMHKNDFRKTWKNRRSVGGSTGSGSGSWGSAHRPPVVTAITCYSLFYVRVYSVNAINCRKITKVEIANVLLFLYFFTL